MNNIKVSILVPVYGVEKYIAQCAKSLFEQDYENIEYIFVNDCTKDKSIEVLKEVLVKYPNRMPQVKIIKHKQNMGLSAARNTALDNATGEYVLPIDSDDFLSINTALSQMVHIIYREHSDVVFYDLQNYPNDSVTINSNIPLNSKQLTKSILSRNAPMSLCGGLYRKSIFINNNIRSVVGISMGEDYAIKPYLTYFMNKISHHKFPYYCYRQDNSNSITKSFKISHVLDLRKCIDGFYKFFQMKPDYMDFKESIEIGEIRCKIECLRLWLHSKSTKDDYNFILKQFPLKRCSINKIPFREYLILQLSLLNLLPLVKYFIFNIKHIKKRYEDSNI